MFRAYKKLFLQLGCVPIVLVSLMLALQAKSPPLSKNSICLRKTALTLRELGAKQIGSSGTTFEVESGVTLTISCSQGTLAAAKIAVTSDQEGAADLHDQGQPTAADDDEEQNCCMSESTYRKLVKVINRLKPLGRPRENDPLSVVEPAGWLRVRDEFTNASLVKVMRNADRERAHIAGFTVFYWLPLKGRVTDKREATVKLGNVIRYSRYFLTLGNAEVEVSDTDYRRIGKGQSVELERTISNDLARILSIRSVYRGQLVQK